MVRDGLQLTREVYDFFPLNRALSLQQEEDSNEVKLETLMHQVTFLVSKMKADVSSTSCVCCASQSPSCDLMLVLCICVMRLDSDLVCQAF